MTERNGNGRSNIPNVIALIAIMIGMAFGFVGFVSSRFSWVIFSLVGILFILAVYLVFRVVINSWIRKADNFIRTHYLGLVSTLVIVAVVGILFIIFSWGIPRLAFTFRSLNSLEQNNSLNPAILSSSNYTDSIFSHDQNYLSVDYILPERGNIVFTAKHSFAGNEKWFVYGRMKETGALTKKTATTKVMFPDQVLRYPFSGGLANWKSNASVLKEYGYEYSLEKYSGAKSLPKVGDFLLWETTKDKNGNIKKYGQLAYVEEIIGESVRVSESRLVIQEKATDTPMLPVNLKYVVICENKQSIEINGVKEDIYGVKLYKNPSKDSEVIAELKNLII